MDDPSPVGAPSSAKTIAGPADLRYLPAHRLAIWQPRGILDDQLVDEIASWIMRAERTSRLPFNRFIDLTHLTEVKLQIGHVFAKARERRESFDGLSAVRVAFLCDKIVSFGVAHLYETLMDNTLIEARAFQDLQAAADWLGVPVEILTLKDEPEPTV